MLTGEKRDVIYKRDPGPFCDRVHPDYVAVRVKDLIVSLDAPAQRPKSPIVRTSDVS